MLDDLVIQKAYCNFISTQVLGTNICIKSHTLVIHSNQKNTNETETFWKPKTDTETCYFIKENATYQSRASPG